jgi:hypothetical protein
MNTQHRPLRLLTATAFTLLAFASRLQPANAQSLLPNGSFEEGDPPTSWRALPGGTLITGNAHRGERYASGVVKQRGIAWASDSASLSPQSDYRLGGWMRCPNGEGSLEVEIADASGKVLRRLVAPTVRAAPDWRYTAVEWNAALATSARVAFRVQGKADLDDVVLSPVATSFIGNKSAEGDDRGRIPLWSEEQNNEVLPGRRAGKFALDSDLKRDGKTSVRLTSEGDWFGLATVNYPVSAWTDRLELSGWARGEGPASAQILACWTDDAQQVLRVDASQSVNGSAWQRTSLVPSSPPTKAVSVRLVAVARGGAVWFDDFELLRLRAQERRIQVFVNQVGYELAGPKTAVVAANFLPASGTELRAQLLTAQGKSAWKQKLPCAGRIRSGTTDDWGWYFWRADFSKFQQAGVYRIAAQAEGARAESPSFQIERDVLLKETAQSAVDFFFIQRCGFAVPGWHKACHLDDAKLPDGGHIDATGGWHSAGDYNKLMYENGDGGVVFALLTAQASAPEAFRRFDRNADDWCDALDEAEWGAKFVAKMQIPETGGVRNHVHQGPGRNWTKWSAPEDHTDNVIGTADDPVIQPGEGSSPLVVGGWARLSVLLHHRGVTNDYLDHAVRLWNHASKQGTQVGSPHLLLSALEMHRVTGEAAYLDYARRSAESLLSQQVTNGNHRGAFGAYGELSAGALASFALAHPDSQLTPPIKRALADYVIFCVGTARNPFGLCTRSADEADGFFPPDMGNNFQLLMRAWAAAQAYRVTRDVRAQVFAADQLDWLLGKNPVGLCMFEGKGTLNPPRYHHRYNSIPGKERGAVPGTIPNGFVREMGLADRPGFDMSRAGGRAPSYRTSEPWLVHNMWYLLAMSACRDVAALTDSRTGARVTAPR